jgi:hypothetical protein
MLRLRHQTSESSWFYPGQLESTYVFALVGPKVIRISAGLGVVEHFYHFLMGATAKTSPSQNRLRNASEITSSVGST